MEDLRVQGRQSRRNDAGSRPHGWPTDADRQRPGSRLASAAASARLREGWRGRGEARRGVAMATNGDAKHFGVRNAVPLSPERASYTNVFGQDQVLRSEQSGTAFLVPQSESASRHPSMLEMLFHLPHGTQRIALHPVEILWDALEK